MLSLTWFTVNSVGTVADGTSQHNIESKQMEILGIPGQSKLSILEAG